MGSFNYCGTSDSVSDGILHISESDNPFVIFVFPKNSFNFIYIPVIALTHFDICFLPSSILYGANSVTDNVSLRKVYYGHSILNDVCFNSVL